MSFEHYDSGRSHVFDQAYFGGSFTDPQCKYGEYVHVVGQPSRRIQHRVHESDALYLYGGADPTQQSGIGSFAAQLDPTTLQPIWFNQLENVQQTGDRSWPGSIQVMSDGSLLAIYGYHIAKLTGVNTGLILIQATLPTPNWSPQLTSYNGLTAMPDGTLIAKPLFGANNLGQFPTQTPVVAINPNTLQVESQVTINDLIDGRIMRPCLTGRITPT